MPHFGLSLVACLLPVREFNLRYLRFKLWQTQTNVNWKSFCLGCVHRSLSFMWADGHIHISFYENYRQKNCLLAISLIPIIYPHTHTHRDKSAAGAKSLWCFSKYLRAILVLSHGFGCFPLLDLPTTKDNREKKAPLGSCTPNSFMKRLGVTANWPI